MPADPPLSEDGRIVVDEFRGQYDLDGMEPNAHCVEPGMPTVMFGIGGAPMEILLQPDRMTILSELQMQVRRIYLDGRESPESYPHQRNGYSVGRWERDTLVVETDLVLDWLLERWPHTEDVRFVERFALRKTEDAQLRPGPFTDPSRIGEEVLVDEMTMIDPALYDDPPQVTIYYRRLGEGMILEDHCAEGIWWQEMDRRREN